MQKLLQCVFCLSIAIFKSTTSFGRMDDNHKLETKSALEIVNKAKEPILLLDIIDERRLTRSFVKNGLFRVVPMTILLQYCKTLQLLLLKMEFATAINGLDQLVRNQVGAPLNIFNTSLAATSRDVSPMGEQCPLPADGQGFDFRSAASPVTSQDGEATSPQAVVAQVFSTRRNPPPPIYTAASPIPKTKQTPGSRSRVVFSPEAVNSRRITGEDPLARSAPVMINCTPGNSMDDDYLRKNLIDQARDKICQNAEKASKCINENFSCFAKNGPLAKVLDYFLPAMSIVMILFSFYIEPYLDHRLGKQLISMIDKGQMIKLPNNEFVRMTFETFAIGGYMFEKSRIVSNVKTLRAACKAIEQRNLATKQKTEYVYWANGRFLS